MKDRNVDNIDKLAKDAFDTFEVPFEPMDWAALQQQLKAESTIDTVAQEALQDYQVNVPTNSWKEFEQLLHQQRYQQRYIWRLKAAEASALVGFLFCILQWVPCTAPDSYAAQPNAASTTLAIDTKASYTSNQDVSTITTTIDNSMASTAKHFIASSTTEAVHRTSVQATASSTTGLELPISTNNTTIVIAEHPQSNVSTIAPTHTDQEATTVDPTTGGIAKATTSTSPAVMTTTQKEVDPMATSTTVAPTGPTNNTMPATNQTTTAASMLKPITLVDLVEDFHTDPFTEIKQATVKAPFQPQHAIGATLGVGTNLANSMGQTSIGYSAGLVYEHGISRHWSIRAGLNANLKRYDRNDKVTLLVGDGTAHLANQFKTTNLVVVEIPVDVQYNILQNDKWRLYATAGISLNAIGSRTYTGTQELEINDLVLSLDLTSDDFERGLMEGGTVQNNVFLSAGAGFGIERQLGNALSLYLLPTYRHAITPVGSDYIHTFNVNIGVKSPIMSKKK